MRALQPYLGVSLALVFSLILGCEPSSQVEPDGGPADSVEVDASPDVIYLDGNITTDAPAIDIGPEVVEGWRVVRGFALLKTPDGPDVRPIAAHEPARRAVARALVASVAPAITTALAPLQSGVGVQGGAEGVGGFAQLAPYGEDGPHTLKANLVAYLGRLSVLKHEDELAVRRAHLVRVHDLIAPADFEDGGEEFCIESTHAGGVE